MSHLVSESDDGIYDAVDESFELPYHLAPLEAKPATRPVVS